MSPGCNSYTLAQDKDMKKYIPYILILVAFFAGQLSGSNKHAEKELKAKFEQERQRDRAKINELLAKLAIKEGQERTIREKMKEDSIASAAALARNKQEYNRLKKRYNEINLSRATSNQLDSLVEVLFSDRRR